ncbi:MAG: hypothetical protein RMH84_02855 [Sulfolobales archaeon]|nr:hypothetical protein [Sulfolobales archaeon]MCX8208858.1 hypothetical protein [Sulfolobales archaeon]MDW8010515.1 hypothetical protein [Sulfolobales archaeon]
MYSVASVVGGRQRTTLFMGVGESGKSKEAEKTKSEVKKRVSKKKEK